MRNSLFILVLILSVFCIGCKKEKTNTPPIINSIELDSTTISPGGIIIVQVIASDPDGDLLNYSYTVSAGSISGIGQNVQIIAPLENGIYNLNVLVTDGKGGEATGYRVFYVNTNPIITDIIISPEVLRINSIASIDVYAIDPDGDQLIYDYLPEAGIITGAGASVTWTSPNYIGNFIIDIFVSDGKATAKAERTISVINNAAPIISEVIIDPDLVPFGGVATVTVLATDPDGDDLTYEYTSSGGYLSGTGSSVTWIAPYEIGTYSIEVSVSDGFGGNAIDEGTIMVVDVSDEIEFWQMKILGSWNSMIGASFATINGMVYALDLAFANQALIDFMYWWGASTSATIGAPDDANANLIYNTGPYALSNWTTKNATRFKTTSLTPAQFDAVTNAAQCIDNAAGANQTRIGTLAVDQVIAFKTVTYKHGLIRVKGIITGSDGSITIDIKVQK